MEEPIENDIKCRGKRQSEKEEFDEEAPKSGQQDVCR